MAWGIPGIEEAMLKLDSTDAKMDQLVARLDTLIGLIIQQNDLLRNQS